MVSGPILVPRCADIYVYIMVLDFYGPILANQMSLDLIGFRKKAFSLYARSRKISKIINITLKFKSHSLIGFPLEYWILREQKLI